ncbi:hypothetical protein O0I10_009118 [Lichtheimia ornata]|uniref:Uncharacterized protein n=1 Tax=Lichtheimia ornata TaxID=688661 RepID=A0AAD7XUS1_9FUNG|nr:uncharacterized protein O0I10_009118 [Lichtheimia ornata]KAJ8655250.1 hypothetical protein O0I10_009118 [Lichtheimia ornata]
MGFTITAQLCRLHHRYFILIFQHIVPVCLFILHWILFFASRSFHSFILHGDVEFVSRTWTDHTLLSARIQLGSPKHWKRILAWQPQFFPIFLNFDKNL